ncbi:MAG: 2-amino-4-hydroxy-6-hydroxymethyldihydropteridine diphosphokinase, partial [Desulfobacterales bacterium]|nr:2-amino-4-hydroxy-6-hydroxymethyldihydropteridine diphosphokinase [Desulfobacterales bacterium]
SLNRLMNLVEGLDPETGELDNFLSAGMMSAHNFSGFMEMTEVVSPGERGDVLSFAAGLSLSDLASFISAAKGENAGDLARTGAELAGKEKSYFLYAASLTGGDTERLIQQTRELEETERRDFLFAAANSDPDSVLGLDNLLDTTAGLDGQDRADYLTGQRTLAEARNSTAAEYVYLNSFFDSGTVDALLSSGARLDGLIDDIDELDGEQRETFLSVAETAGPEMMEEVLSISDQLAGEENDRFMAFARGLNRKNLSNFIAAADTALDGSALGKARLERLMTTAESLSPPEQEDFLNAAAGAGTALDELMDMTDRLGGSRRVDFLIAADNFVDRPDGELLLPHFISATDRMLERNFNDFMLAADQLGRRPGDIITGDGNLVGTGGKYSIDDFLRSAAWLAETGASNETTRLWVDSFLGIPGPG